MKKPFVATTFVAFLVCGLVQGTKAFAQQEDIADLSLDELLEEHVVTAAGVVEERSLASANVHVITASDIERNGWHSLREILEHVPGMYVIDDHVAPMIGIRENTPGFRGGTSMVKVMIDGYAVNFRPDQNAFLGPEFIPIDAVKRIEIARGPLSALYGANAFMAIVNVITHRNEASTPQATLRGSIRGANHYGSGLSAIAGHSEGHVGLLLGLVMDTVDRSGLSPSQTYPGLRNNPVLDRKSSDDLSRPFGLFSRLRLEGDWGRVYLEGGVQRTDNNGEFLQNSVLTHHTRISLTNMWATLVGERSFGDRWSLLVRLGGSRGSPSREYREYGSLGIASGFAPEYSSYFVPSYEYRTITAAVETNIVASSTTTLKVGTDFELTEESALYYTRFLNAPPAGSSIPPLSPIVPSTISDSTNLHPVLRQNGLFLQATGTPLHFIPALRITGSGRLDNISFGNVDYSVQPSIRGSIAYRFGRRFSTRLNIGRAFQAPSGAVLFSIPSRANNQDIIGSVNNPNGPDLKPQLVASEELSGTLSFGRHLSIDMAIFHSNIRNEIEFVRTGVNFMPMNGGTRNVAGTELVLHSTFWRIQCTSALSITDSILKPLDKRPMAYPTLFGFVDTSLDLLRGLLWGTAKVRFANGRRSTQTNELSNNGTPYQLPPYAIVDVGITAKNLMLLSDRLGTRVRIGVQNLLDTRRNEPGFGGVDIPQLGRTFVLQVTQEL